MKKLGPEEHREKCQVCGTDDLVNELASWLWGSVTLNNEPSGQLLTAHFIAL